MDMHHEAGYPNQTSKTAKPFQSNKIKETKTDSKASQKKPSQLKPRQAYRQIRHTQLPNKLAKPNEI
jgi:hypothetical protein